MTNRIEMSHHNHLINPSFEVLHTKPFCSYIFKTIQHLYVDSIRCQFDQTWKKNIFAIAITSITHTAYLITAIVSLVESVASVVLCLIATFVQIYLTADNQKLKNLSLKIFAYSTQSICSLSIALLTIFTFHSNEWSRPNEHVRVTLLDCSNYLASAAIAQLIGSALFNFIRNKQDQSATLRANQVIIEGTPKVFAKITQSVSRDYAVIGANRLYEPEIFARDYILNNPPTQKDWIQDFNLINFVVDHTLGPLRELIDLYSEQVQFIEENLITSREENIVILNTYETSDQQYHNFLKICVKSSVKKMITHRYAKWLDAQNNFENGKELVYIFDASAAIPVANLTQFEELRGSIVCPLNFATEELAQYNNPSRRIKLEELKILTNSLSTNDKDLLIERLIKTSDFQLTGRSYDHEESVNTLYFEICNLAGSLHQGQLLTLPTINIDNLDGGGINYFGVSWGEAVSELMQESE